MCHCRGVSALNALDSLHNRAPVGQTQMQAPCITSCKHGHAASQSTGSSCKQDILKGWCGLMNHYAASQSSGSSCKQNTFKGWC